MSSTIVEIAGTIKSSACFHVNFILVRANISPVNKIEIDTRIVPKKYNRSQTACIHGTFSKIKYNRVAIFHRRVLAAMPKTV